MTNSPYITIKNRWIHLSCFTTLFILQGCATHTPAATKTEAVTVDNQPTELAQAQQKITQLQAKIQDLDTRLTAMNEKINLKINPESMETKVAQPPASMGRVIPKAKTKSSAIEEEAIVQDEATDSYREAKILFDSGKFADSVLEFSDFVKNFPHHAFAPAAQYFLGMAYYQQKEYKLAEEEWSRELISFPHSQYTADTLRGLVDVSDQLKKPEKVTYFEQRLLMLFANAPQAKGTVAKNVTDHPAKEAEETPANLSEKMNAARTHAVMTEEPSVGESEEGDIPTALPSSSKKPAARTAPTKPVPPTSPIEPTVDDGVNH